MRNKGPFIHSEPCCGTETMPLLSDGLSDSASHTLNIRELSLEQHMSVSVASFVLKRVMHSKVLEAELAS